MKYYHILYYKDLESKKSKNYFLSLDGNIQYIYNYKTIVEPKLVDTIRTTSYNNALFFAKQWAKKNKIPIRHVKVMKAQE